MQITTKGLILREVKTREADRILTILTPSHGLISAAAKSSLRPKSKLFSATSLFCYSDFTLFEGKHMYQVNEASPLEVFFGLREDIESLSLATYIAELLQILSPTGEESKELLQLTLNSFYLLANHKKEVGFIKSVFEMRSFSEAGFMPDLVACEDCGKYQDKSFYFNIQNGSILCENCAAQHKLIPNIDSGTLTALRHIVFSEQKKLFSFEIGPENLFALTKITEEYVLSNMDYPPKSLAFYNSLFP